MKISILTPSFNSIKTIEKTIQSVLDQNYPDVEHIIMDGQSNDGTVEVFKKYPHLNWTSEPDKSQSDAMNKAFNKATGDIVTYLNADDWFEPGAFDAVVKAFKETEADMVVGNMYEEIHGERKERIINYGLESVYHFYRDDNNFPLNPVCYFYKRELQERAGEFPMENHYSMDVYFLLRLFHLQPKITKIDDFLGTFYWSGDNKTAVADSMVHCTNEVLDYLEEYNPDYIPVFKREKAKYLKQKQNKSRARKLYYSVLGVGSKIKRTLTGSKTSK